MTDLTELSETVSIGLSSEALKERGDGERLKESLLDVGRTAPPDQGKAEQFLDSTTLIHG